MSLVELLGKLEELRMPVLSLAFLSPLLLRGVPMVWKRAEYSPVYARTAAAAVACGLVTLTFSIACMTYFIRTGTDLAKVNILYIVAPIWFGGGLVFSGTRKISFTELRRYPVLRRVWSLLMAGLLLFAAFLVLRHTYWVVFSGIFGFLIVAVVVWTLLGALAERAFDPDNEGSEELLDQVAERSRKRLQRLSDAAIGSSTTRPSVDDD